MGADKGQVAFHPAPAASFANHQTIGKLTIAADVYQTAEEIKSAFGKLNPTKYGVLPILVVMQNDSDQTLRLDRMRVEYIRPDKRPIDPIPAAEVKYLRGGDNAEEVPRPRSYPIPGIGGGRRHKNPLAAFEIEGRAFSPRMLPPGDFAYGFFYFNSAYFEDSILYITGITKARTGQALFYYEIALD